MKPTHADLVADTVMRALTDRGATVTYEYPGVVVIQVTPTVQFWLSDDYAAANISRYDGDMYQPDESDYPYVELPSNPSADQIAAAWLAYIADTTDKR